MKETVQKLYTQSLQVKVPIYPRFKAYIFHLFSVDFGEYIFYLIAQ